MRANWNEELAKRLQRADPAAHLLVEAVSQEAEDIRQRKDQWAAATRISGTVAPLDDGGVALGSGALSAIVESTTSDGFTTDFQAGPSPFRAARLDWARGRESQEIHRVSLWLVSQVDPGTPQEIAQWKLTLYRVDSYTNDGSQTTLSLQPIAAPVLADAPKSTAPGAIDFDFVRNGYAPRVGAAPRAPEGTAPLSSTAGPVLYLVLEALTSEGAPAGNAAWAIDRTLSSVAGGGATLMSDGLQRVDEGPAGGHYLRAATSSGLPRLSLFSGGYAEAELGFDTAANRLTLAALSGTSAIELIAEAETPGGSSVATFVSADNLAWYEYHDGDVVGAGGLAALPRQAFYYLKATLSPDANGYASPILRAVGLRAVELIDLEGLATVRVGGWAVDPITLKGEIAEATITVARDGETDYRDVATEILSKHYTSTLYFRLWVGHPDLARQYWMLLDVFLIDDYDSAGASVRFDCLSPLALLRTALPVPEETGPDTVERQPLKLQNVTLSAAYAEILDGRIGLPGRYRGEGIPAATADVVSKQVTDSDAKVELDALAYLAGGGILTSQGRVKFVDLFGSRPPVAVFPSEEIEGEVVTPGLRQRVPEFFVPYSWRDDEERYLEEVRSFHGPSLVHVGTLGLDAPPRLEDDVAQWIPAKTLAQEIGKRTVQTLGAGLLLWSFRSTYAHPHLEPGDPVLVATDRFVARDPNTGRELKGALWALGVVQAVRDPMGRSLTIWIRGYADLLAVSEDIARARYGVPTVSSTALGWNETTDQLELTALPGLSTWSGVFEISDDDFATVADTASIAVMPAELATVAFDLPAGGRGRTWKGRVRPFNDGLDEAGVPTGSEGRPGIDSAYVGEISSGTGVLIQYAQDAQGTGAHGAFDPETDTYSRWSSDGGQTWTAWFLFIGEQGIPGAPGANGQTSYLHLKYSDDGGVTLTANGGETPGAWLGQYVDFTQLDSADPADYKWKKIEGPQGPNGADGVAGANGVSIVWKGTFAAHLASPQNGWAYRNSTDGKSYVYQDGTWYQMTIDGTDGQDGADGLSIVWKGELASPPASPQKNWVYRDTDNGQVYLYNGSAWELMVVDGSDGTDGAAGADGLSVFITYHDNPLDSPPLTPTGNGTTGGWHTNTSSAVRWASQKVAASASEGVWGDPFPTRGEKGDPGDPAYQPVAYLTAVTGAAAGSQRILLDAAQGTAPYQWRKKVVGYGDADPGWPATWQTGALPTSFDVVVGTKIYVVVYVQVKDAKQTIGASQITVTPPPRFDTTEGTVDDSQLSANVPLLDRPTEQVWSGPQTIVNTLDAVTLKQNGAQVATQGWANGQFLKRAALAESWAQSTLEPKFLSSATDGPAGAVNVMGVHLPHVSSTGYATQFAARDSLFYARTKENGVWQAWKTLADRDWTDGRYLKLSGGALTGLLSFLVVASAGNVIADFGRGYDLWCDNTGTGGVSRLWLNAPNNGEIVLGPRSSASILDQLRIRAHRVLLDGGGNLTVATPVDGGAAIYVGRQAGQASIRGSADHLILDSPATGGYVSLNHYSSDNVVLVAGGGKVGIGANMSAPAYLLEVGGTVGGTNFYTTSSRAKKKDIRPWSGGLELLRRVRVVEYRFRDDDEELQVGFIAEDTPTLLSGARRDSMKVNTTVGVLLAAVQELDARLAAVEGRNG